MNKFEVYKYLSSKNIWYEVTEHKAVYNMSELFDVQLPYQNLNPKNLFIRDDKKQNYYLITIRGDKRVNLKEFRNKYNTRSLSFASEDDLNNILGLCAGAVTPLGVLNDMERKVQVFIDNYFFNTKERLIGIHPNENTATIWLNIDDLVKIIKSHGNKIFIIDV